MVVCGFGGKELVFIDFFTIEIADGKTGALLKLVDDVVVVDVDGCVSNGGMGDEGGLMKITSSS